MLNRSAKFVPALFAAMLAGASLTAVTDLRAQTTQAQATQPPADNCLAAPGSKTPPGGHWYYRIDRATKAKCWYLREKNDQASDKSSSDKPARAAPQDTPAATSAAAAEPAPPPPTTITRKAVADARAEWISQQARTEQKFPANIEPQATGAVAAPPVEDDKQAAAPNVLAPTPLAETRWPETRWPETSAVSSSNNPTDLRTAAADPTSGQPERPAEMQQPAPAPVAPAAVEPPTAKPTVSMQMLFLVMAAALALAGITVGLVMHFGRVRARAVMRRNRREIWDVAQADTRAFSREVETGLRQENASNHESGGPVRLNRNENGSRRPSRPVHPGEESRMRRTEGAHHPRPPENREREREVRAALARLARSAQT
jgi:hypothetical protein